MNTETTAGAGPADHRVKPTAWIRKRSDGGYEGPIADSDPRMDKVRRMSGAWTPLYEHDEMSPDFTDFARAALLWVLWHHQGGSSPIGQPLRFALGMGADERLSESQVREAKRWAAARGNFTLQKPPEKH